MKLVIDNVSKSFVSRTGHTLPVLQDINLTVNEEEFVALVGPSGCGKSTLFKHHRRAACADKRQRQLYASATGACAAHRHCFSGNGAFSLAQRLR